MADPDMASAVTTKGDERKGGAGLRRVVTRSINQE